jgi:soluble lytic murein transglycosylase-like protein
MTALVWLGGLLALALLVGEPAVAGAQGLLRIEDEAGVVHYTNNPCHPLYRRLAPDACRPPEPAPTAVAAAPAPGSAPPLSARRFAREIEQTAGRYGIDHRLVQAMVQVESGGNPRAISPKGARGLMQLMPARAEALGVRDSFDPDANLDGGVRHLKELLGRYGGDLTLTLAAYNAGEDAVRLHNGVPPFRETQDYVRKVLAIYSPAVPAPGAAPAKPVPVRATPPARKL